MNSVFLFLRSVFAYCVVGLVTVIIFIPCFFIAALPENMRYDNRIYYFLTRVYYRVILWSTFLPVKIIGKKYIPEEPAIIVANHQSSLDIPTLGSLANGHPHVWLFLVRFAKIPLFGFIVRRMNIVVDHSGLRKLVRSLEEALIIINKYKSHVMLFPEGGRYIDGKIHDFFYGFAILAKKTKRPVVPVFMRNLGRIYPPGAFLLRPGNISVVIGEAFYFDENETEEEFVKRVRAWFEQKAAE